jgi:hypothetical protein
MSTITHYDLPRAVVVDPLNLDRPAPVGARARKFLRHLCIDCLPGCLVIHAVLHIAGVG